MLNVLLPSFVARDHRKKGRFCWWNWHGYKVLRTYGHVRHTCMPSEMRTKYARAMLP